MVELGTVVVGVDVRTTFDVVIVIDVAGMVLINLVVGCEQRRRAYMRVCVIVTVAIPTALIISVLTVIMRQSSMVYRVPSVLRSIYFTCLASPSMMQFWCSKWNWPA